MAIKQLGELESVSALIVLRLQLTREIITEALSRLRMNHAAQVNLLSIICRTRFKYYQKGFLLPTRCPNRRGGRQCDTMDTFSHLARCYNLVRHEAKGYRAIKFLTILGKRTIPTQGGLPRLLYVYPNEPQNTQEP